MAIKNHVPTKTISGRWKIPWITPGLRRLMRKKQTVYNLAKRMQNPQHWKKFKELQKNLVRQEEFTIYWKEILDLHQIQKKRQCGH